MKYAKYILVAGSGVLSALGLMAVDAAVPTDGVTYHIPAADLSAVRSSHTCSNPLQFDYMEYLESSNSNQDVLFSSCGGLL